MTLNFYKLFFWTAAWQQKENGLSDSIRRAKTLRRFTTDAVAASTNKKKINKKIRQYFVIIGYKILYTYRYPL